MEILEAVFTGCGANSLCSTSNRPRFFPSEFERGEPPSPGSSRRSVLRGVAFVSVAEIP